jgi:glutathione S-transferase
MLSQLPAAVTLLTLLLMSATMYMVGKARKRYGIKAPATGGDPAFERVFRVQMNTLESTVMFIPALWLASQYADPVWAGIAGLVWLVGRVWYAAAYAREASRRGPGFMLGLTAWAALLVMSGIGVVRAMLANA